MLTRPINLEGREREEMWRKNQTETKTTNQTDQRGKEGRKGDERRTKGGRKEESVNSMIFIITAAQILRRLL